MHLHQKIILYLFLLQFGAILPIFSQSVATEQFGPEQGLNSLSISCITLSSRGHLWIGSDDRGLFSFDGKIFKSYSRDLEHLEILSIHENILDQKIYIGVKNGFYVFDGWHFKYYPNQEDITFIHAQNDRIYLASKKALLTFSNHSITNLEDPSFCLRNNQINDIEVHKDKLYVATDKGLLVKENGSLNYIEYDQRSELENTSITSLYSDENVLYLGTRKGKIHAYSDGKKTESRLLNKRNTSIGEIKSLDKERMIILDDEGNIQTIHKAGIASELDIIKIKRHDIDAKISCIAIGNEKQIWLGSKTNGILKRSQKAYKSFHHSYDHYSIVDDNLFFSTGSSVHSIIKGEKVENLFNISLQKDERITKLEKVDDSHWMIGSSSGRSIIKNIQSGKEKTLYECKMPKAILGIHYTPGGSSYIIDISGNIKICKPKPDDDESCESINTLGIFDHSQLIDFVHDEGENIWLASREGKIIHFNRGQLLQSYDVSLIHQDGRIKDLEINDRGEIFFLSGSGIGKIKGGELISLALIKEGNFNSFAYISDEQFLVGNKYGLSILQIKGKQFAQNVLLENDPLLSQILPRGIHRLRKSNSYLIAGRKNTIILDPEALNIQNKDAAFFLNLVGISIKHLDIDKSVYADSLLSWYELKKGSQFNQKDKSLTFKVSAHSLDPFSDFEYRYKLVGKDNHWSKWTNETNYKFGNIKAGKYQFFFQARYGDRIIEKNTPQFSIQAIWYLRGDVLIMGFLSCLIILILILIAINRWKKRKLKIALNNIDKINEKIGLELKTKQLQMSPHFLSNAMQNAQGLILADQKEQARSYINALSILSRKILEHSRVDQISLEEEISMIRNYLNLEQLAKNGRFDYSIEIDEQINPKNLAIPPLLIQPLVENAIKHGIKGLKKEGKIFIRFELISAVKSICIIEDNGSPEANRSEIKNTNDKSISMEVISKRLKLLHGKEGDWLQFFPSGTKNKGNVCKIVFPVQKNNDEF